MKISLSNHLYSYSKKEKGNESTMSSFYPGTGICFIFTDYGVPTYYQIGILGLIALLGMKEMLVISNINDRFATDSFDMVIYPLMICFIAAFFDIGLNIIFAQMSPSSSVQGFL
jgi:hypothetical protein